MKDSAEDLVPLDVSIPLNRRMTAFILGTAAASWALAFLGVCYSRIFLGVHYLSDVLGALAMALTTLPIAVMVANKILGRMSRAQVATALRVWAAVLLAMTLGLPFL